MERDWMNISWQSLVVRGAVGIVFGILAMVWPTSTAIALALLFGFWALVDGVGSLAQAFQKDATGRVWLVVMGVIALIAAFFAIFSPAVTAVALTWILGIWLVVRGIFELVGAFASSTQMPRWLLVVGGLLSIVLGVLFAANPGRAAVAHRLLAGAHRARLGHRVRRPGLRRPLREGPPAAPGDASPGHRLGVTSRRGHGSSGQLSFRRTRLFTSPANAARKTTSKPSWITVTTRATWPSGCTSP